MAKSKGSDTADDDDVKDGTSKLKLIAIILPALLLVGGGLYYFLAPTSGSSHAASASGEHGASQDGAEAEPSSTYTPGATIPVDPVTINLAGGHYLKVGLLLQATADAGEEVPPGKAADCLITEFSGRTVDELADAEGREGAKKELLKSIKEAYEDKVYEIYYTTFVMN